MTFLFISGGLHFSNTELDFENHIQMTKNISSIQPSHFWTLKTSSFWKPSLNSMKFVIVSRFLKIPWLQRT